MPPPSGHQLLGQPVGPHTASAARGLAHVWFSCPDSLGALSDAENAQVTA